MSQDHGAQRREQLIGIALLLLAVAFFACLDSTAKWLSPGYHALQIGALRYLGSFVFTAIALNPVRQPEILRSRMLWLQCARAFCLAFSTFCSFMALRSLSLTTATAITFAAPLIAAVLAGPVLGEWIGPRRLVAVLAGFLGVLVITRPGGSGFQPAMLYSVGVACSNALYFLATRRLALRDGSATTMFYTGLVGSLLFLPVLPFVWQAPASLLDGLLLAALGLFGALGHGLLIVAHRRATSSVLAPFFYAQLLWAIAIGVAVFGEVPDRWTLLGGAVVIGSGLYLLRREQARGAGG
ncbi:DMT family transporter [Roseomonas sp. OT10]|uniref:DMT family transporter n=1 Tax=Roseomonas cutis TaxID=2897332 RepID=UPI001E482478|nr:DMT family transporter [Roseomonas sp. OT10]UFN47015.1 DMT family transporter [Roseomonas sp. OT10]